MFSKILQVLLYLPFSLWLNFTKLPLKQAIYLPILVGSHKVLKCKGLLRISGGVKFGMIKLGFGSLPFYPRKNLRFINEGIIEFRGKCHIGNSCTISVPKNGNLIFGSNFSVSAGLRLACHKKIEFGDNVLVGWGCTILDSDMHSIKDINGKLNARATIHIGSDNWICEGCTILKGVKTPSWTVIGASSVVSKDFSHRSGKILIAGNPAKIIKEGVWHDYFDDVID